MYRPPLHEPLIVPEPQELRPAGTRPSWRLPAIIVGVALLVLLLLAVVPL
jgi:hypothetical protein